jgi:hypothetical protein
MSMSTKTRADQQIVLAGGQKGQGKRAVEPRQGFRHHLVRREALCEEMRRQDRHRLGVSVGAEDIAEPGEFAAQDLEILDDAVVDDGDPVGRNRWGVGLCRRPMGRPTGMTDADHPLHRLVVEPSGEVDQVALGPPAFDPAVDEGCDPVRIIAAVFEAPEPFEKSLSYPVLGEDTDDPAHQLFAPLSLARISLARPGLSTCCPRAIVSASAGTSWVITLPAAT